MSLQSLAVRTRRNILRYHHDHGSSLCVRGPSGEKARERFPQDISCIEPLNRGKTSNVQHRTPNAEVLPFDVRRWMFDVGCSSGFMRRGALHRIETAIGIPSPL